MSVFSKSTYLRCDCTETAFVPKVPPCPTDCLIVKSPYTDCNDSPPPGGATGTIDMGAINDLSVCTGCTPTYTLLSYDKKVFPAMTLDPDTGVLNWTTGGSKDAIAGQFYPVLYRVDCSCEGLASQGIINICIKNLCGQKSCAPGEGCDPITGLCVPLIDIEVT